MAVDNSNTEVITDEANAQREQELITVAIAKELNISLKQVRTTVGLLDEEIPFRSSPDIGRK